MRGGWGHSSSLTLYNNMIVQEIPFQLVIPPPRQPRSAGVHVSSIIRSIAAKTGVLKPEWVEDMDEVGLTDGMNVTDPTAILRICIGLAWEEWFIPQLPQVVDHPGEMCLDNIYMNCDAEEVGIVMVDSHQKHRLIIDEVKSTYKSTKTVGDLSTQWMWLSQLKSYCKGKDTRWARLYVLFLCGDYKYPIVPQLRQYDVEFEQEEVDGLWDLMTEYRDEKVREINK